MSGLPLHEIAALGTALCWSVTGLFAADAVRSLGPFHFNLIRQLFIAALLAAIVGLRGFGSLPDWPYLAALMVSGVVGILIGDTFNFAAVGRLGPRRAGALFALNAPFAAIMGWAFLGETLPPIAVLGIAMTAGGVALAILGRGAQNAHRLEMITGALLASVLFGLGAAFTQAAGSLIARPAMLSGIDPYFASMLRVGASGGVMAALAATPLAPRPPTYSKQAVFLTAATAILGLGIGMTLLLYALQGSQTGIISTLSATSPILILPMLWLRTGQRPSGISWAGAALAVIGLALIFSR